MINKPKDLERVWQISTAPKQWEWFFVYVISPGDATLYERLVRSEFKDVPIELLEELAKQPCYNHIFLSGNCTNCGAMESVFNSWNAKGKIYLGNDHLIDKTLSTDLEDK